MLDKKFILILSIIYLISRLILSNIIYIFDDAFITFRYAENLANGYGLIYNLNENYLGVSTPLYSLICSFFSYINIKLVDSIFIFNSLFELASLLIIFKLFNIKSNLQIFFTFLVVILSPYIFRITLGGMESNLFLLVSLLSIYLYSKNNFILTSILSSLNCFIRPEGILLIIVIIIFMLYEKKYNQLLKSIFIGLIIGIIGISLIHYNYGVFIPQSISSKSEIAGVDIFEVLKSIFWKDKVSLVLLIPSIIYFYKNKSNKLFLLIAFWLISFLVFYLITKPQIWTWYCYTIWMLISITGVIQISNFINRFNFEKFKYFISILPILISIFLYFNIENNVKKNIYLELEKYFEDFNTNEYTIYANDIGAIGYFSKQFIYDSESLIHNIASEYNKKEDIVKYKKPDYLFINNTKFNFELLKYELENYIFLRAFNKNGDINFPKSHPTYWNQDYLLYIRRDIYEKRNQFR